MITILGSTGFIGTHLVNKMTALKIPYQTPRKNEDLAGKDLGTVIYCIGLTADFRTRPFDTVEAHVCRLLEVLRDTKFASILYLSSTRLYGMGSLSNEKSEFRVDPQNPSDLYNLSKLMGEALLSAYGPRTHVVRLSNVYGEGMGKDNFLPNVIQQAVQLKHITLETSLDSEKDYINVDDVSDVLLKIAFSANNKVYNVASGINVSNRQIVNKLVALTNCSVEVVPEARTIKFPAINIETIHSEFGFYPSSLLNEMENLVGLYQNQNGE